MPRKLLKVKSHLNDKLRNPQFKESYAIELFKAHIANELISIRVKTKTTQGQLARKIGVSQQVISKIENGEFESIKTVIRILLALNRRLTVILPSPEVPLKSLK